MNHIKVINNALPKDEYEFLKDVFIDKEQKHQPKNIGEDDLIFIEIQLGSYFGEDDIVRLEDKYGRI